MTMKMAIMEGEGGEEDLEGSVEGVSYGWSQLKGLRDL
jgi:hypothetical protein